MTAKLSRNVSCNDCANIRPWVSIFTLFGISEAARKFARCAIYPRGAEYFYCSVVNPHGDCELFTRKEGK